MRNPQENTSGHKPQIYSFRIRLLLELRIQRIKYVKAVKSESFGTGGVVPPTK